MDGKILELINAIQQRSLLLMAVYEGLKSGGIDCATIKSLSQEIYHMTLELSELSSLRDE